MSGRATVTPRAPGSMWDDDSKREYGHCTKNGQDLDPEIRMVNNRVLKMPTAPPTAPQKMPTPSQPPRRDGFRDDRSRGDRHRDDGPREDRHRSDRSRSEEPLRNPIPRGTASRESSRPPPAAATAPHRSSNSSRYYAPPRPPERQAARGVSDPPAYSAAGAPRASPRSTPSGERRGGEGSSRVGREQRGRSPPVLRSRRW